MIFQIFQPNFLFALAGFDYAKIGDMVISSMIIDTGFTGGSVFLPDFNPVFMDLFSLINIELGANQTLQVTTVLHEYVVKGVCHQNLSGFSVLNHMQFTPEQVYDHCPNPWLAP